MQTLSQIIGELFAESFVLCGVQNDAPVLLVEASKPAFGDFQINGVMAVAKSLKKNPRELATLILQKVLELETIRNLKMFAKLEVAGAGFINIFLANEFLESVLKNLSPNNNYGALLAKNECQTVVVDMSSPNLAKEMHVGHLRSTVIGDAIANACSYVGHKVIRQNHVGDFGTQFGMLIAYLMENVALSTEEYGSKLPEIADLENFYRAAKKCFDEDVAFANRARSYVVILQNWQEEGELGVKIHKYWQLFCDISLKHANNVYKKLQVNLTPKDEAPESQYNDQLAWVVADLASKGLLVTSNGAKCAFFAKDELSGGEETPFIVEKQDGGYLYATTDLAAIYYRTHSLKANRIIYVVDARQSLHFKQLFTVAKKAGYASPSTTLQHVAFGTMMGEDKRPFKTRSGGTIKLIDLIEEATTRALALVTKRGEDSLIEDKLKFAETLAVSAIKYSDLSKNRISDYVFNFDTMLSFEGNTAPYLLYAYTRIQSVLKKVATTQIAQSQKENVAIESLSDAIPNINWQIYLDLSKITLGNEYEHNLALALTRFADIVQMVANDCYPNFLCQYLYNLSGLFMRFYEHCSILGATNREMQDSRVMLAILTGQILRDGLNILGIDVVDRM